MPATLTWQGPEAIKIVGTAGADALLRAAFLLQQVHRDRINVPNPKPYLNSSKPSEYPKRRTGKLRNNVQHDPKDVRVIERQGNVTVYYAPLAPYAIHLLNSGRKMLADTVEEIRGQLINIVTTGNPNG